ncbi:MAG: succinate dehydrogenase iron-sulfur subunit [Chloroflexota bacterium]
MTDNPMVNVKVKRYNPDIDRKPYYQTFQIELTPEKTVLDALEEIKATQDGSLTFRRSCRHAICGSCAMMVNRRNTLVCTKPLKDVVNEGGLFAQKDTVMIEPLPYLPIIKDLVVDRTVFWEQYVAMKPWLIPPAATPDKEYRMSQVEVDAMEQAETCIMCGACYSSCPVVAGNKDYIGPHAMLKQFMRVMDPRDQAPEERLDSIATADGAFRCHRVINCIDACPKGLNPAKAIAHLAQMSLNTGRITGERAERLKTLIATADDPSLQPPDAHAHDGGDMPQVMPDSIQIRN